MIIRNRAMGIALSAIAVLTLTASLAQSQSSTKDYGSNLSKGFVNRNSASQFSTSRLVGSLKSRSMARPFSVRSSLGSYSPPQTAKPFSSISRSPTVSPYLALNNSFNQVSDYYNLVRPQREQQRVNQQLQRQNRTNQRRLNQMAARGPYSPKGDENSAPTGHAAVFQNLGTYLNTGGYYPGIQAPRR